jgi:serine/threonine protein kinase
MGRDESPGTERTLTSGLPAFSPTYAAPEQVAFGRTGPWTDVHALGLILTEMLVDEAPYQEQDMQLFEAVMSQQRPTPRKRGRHVGPWEAVIGKGARVVAR